MAVAFPLNKDSRNGRRAANPYYHGGGGTTAFSVTQTLTDVESSFEGEEIDSGETLTAVLSVESGYMITAVTVTMGGEDITATAYNSSTSTVEIAEVTGDVVIVATATAEQAGGGINLAGPNLVNINLFKDFSITVRYTDRYMRQQTDTFTHRQGETDVFSKLYQVLSESDFYITFENLADSESWIVSATAGSDTEQLGTDNPITIKLSTPANPESAIVGLYSFTFDYQNEVSIELAVRNGLFATETTVSDFSVVTD